MKHIILIILCILIQTQTLPSISRVSKSYSSPNSSSVYDDLTLGELKSIKSLERTVFGCSFETDNTNSRLERLESKVLGACGSGSFKERLYRIKMAVDSTKFKTYQTSYGNFINTPYYPSNSYYTNRYYPPNYPVRPVYQNKIRAIRNLLQGNMTGYTIPPIQNVPIQNYSNPNTNFRNVFQNGQTGDMYYSNGSYYTRNLSTDGGVGVTIIQD